MNQIYSEFSNEKVTFGQHRGSQIKDLPVSYLKWLVATVTNRVMAEKFALELARRNKFYR